VFRSYITELQEQNFLNINSSYEQKTRINTVHTNPSKYMQTRLEVGVLNTGADTFVHLFTLLIM